MEIDVERQLPFLVGNVLNLLETRLVRCVVDENVDPSQSIDRGVQPDMR